MTQGLNTGPITRRSLLKAGSAAGVGFVAGGMGQVAASDVQNCDAIVDAEGDGDFETIQAAIDDVESGATVCVGSGVYEEKVNIGKPITLVGDTGEHHRRGAGEEAPIIEGSHEGRATAFSLHRRVDGDLEWATDVTIAGFEIRNWGSTQSWGKGIAGGNNTNITIRDCRFDDVWSGIVNHNPGGGGRYGWSVVRNRFVNVGNHGVLLQNANDVRIENNLVVGGDARDERRQYTFQPIKVTASPDEGNSAHSRNIQIVGNELTGDFEDETSDRPGSGIFALAINRNEPDSDYEAIIENIDIAGNSITTPHDGGGDGRLFKGIRIAANPVDGARVRIENVTVSENIVDGPKAAFPAGTSFERGLVDVTYDDNVVRNSENGFSLGTPPGKGIGAVEYRGNRVTDSETGFWINDRGSNSPIEIVENQIRDNKSGLVLKTGGVESKTVTSNNFVENSEFGLGVDAGDGRLDAQCNYWGHASGPRHEDNRAGQGQPVGGDVIFDPWLRRPFEDARGESCRSR